MIKQYVFDYKTWVNSGVIKDIRSEGVNVFWRNKERKIIET